MIFGALEIESLRTIADLSRREKLLLYPLAALVILFGVYPAPVFDVTQASVEMLINNYQAAIDKAGTLAMVQ